MLDFFGEDVLGCPDGGFEGALPESGRDSEVRMESPIQGGREAARIYIKDWERKLDNGEFKIRHQKTTLSHM